MKKAICVQFQQISKYYTTGTFRRRRIQALDQITLDIFAGDVFGLIGPNRAGKTTLAKILLSICRPTSGRFVRLGRDGRERSTLARVGYMHERQAFPRNLTGEQLLQFYGTMSFLPAAELRRRTDELLRSVGLSQWRASPIAHYSKGMVQRLSLAQALINDPDLLVLDEPTEGMDQAARSLIYDTVTTRQRQKRTTVLISHSMGDVKRLCNRIAVLHAGRLTYCGPVDDFVSNELGDAKGHGASPALERALEPLYATVTA